MASPLHKSTSLEIVGFDGFIVSSYTPKMKFPRVEESEPDGAYDFQ
jgi:hypothetical protein